MDALDLALRGVLFVVFLLAGVAKLRDRGGTAAAVVAFGVPRRLARPVSVLLPAMELVTAGLLVSSATALVGALIASALLTTFTVAIAVSLAHGRRPPCRCFGQMSAEPVGGRTLLRNAVLLAAAGALAAIELARPSPTPFGWIGDAGVAAPWVVAIALGAASVAAAVALALALLRAYGRVLRRMDDLERRLQEALGEAGFEEPEPELGLEPGTVAPLAEVVDIDGRSVVPAEPLRLAILFTSPHCGPCADLLPEIAEWQGAYADRLAFAVAVDGTLEEARAEAEGHGLERVIIDEGSALADAFEARATPSAVLVDHDGAVASWVATGVEAIRNLVYGAARPEPVTVGDPAPGLELAALDGARFTLADLQGSAASVVFWNPSCGFCREMHDQLRDYTAGLNGAQSALVIASSGTPEETLAEDFSSRVVLDDERRLADAFGARGTPMAVSLAPDGTVASEVAAGAEAVLDLLEDEAAPGAPVRLRT